MVMNQERLKKLKIKIKVPDYFDAFSCIGSACTDNCCIGWNVDIDRVTYQKYKAIQTLPLKSIIQKKVKENPYSYDPSVDYAYVKLKKGKKCAFLDEDKLCLIQKTCGESYLSNVCTTFPRLYNEIDGQLEGALGAACPEALRLFLLNPKGIQFKEKTITSKPHLINYKVDTSEPIYKGSPVESLLEIRNQSIAILQDRQMPFLERMTLLGYYVVGIENHDNPSNKFLKEGVDRIDLRKNKIEMKPTDRLDAFYKWMSQILDARQTVDNKRYLKRTEIFTEGFKQPIAVFQSAFDKVDHYFVEKPYVLENFYVNLCYKNLFPFTEAEGLFNAYLLFYIRLVMIYYELSGLVAIKGEINDQEVLDYLQCMTKAIEHHDRFFITCIDQLKETHKNTMDYIIKLSEE